VNAPAPFTVTAAAPFAIVIEWVSAGKDLSKMMVCPAIALQSIVSPAFVCKMQKGRLPAIVSSSEFVLTVHVAALAEEIAAMAKNKRQSI